MTRAEALIHGDLHTGSVMVRGDGSTRAFDGEFCFYGPVGFDLGLLWANFIVTLARDAVLGRDEHGAGWRRCSRSRGTGSRTSSARCGRSVVDPRVSTSRSWSAGWRRSRRDAAGFAATEAARRIVGLAHVADIESLSEAERAVAGAGVIGVVRRLLLERPETAAEVSAVAAEEVARG